MFDVGRTSWICKTGRQLAKMD